MWSVCLDIFSMPPVEWEGEEFNCFLMCVDRLTGWMVARPSQKEGLTGKKAVHLLLDNSWGEIGIPGIITSDQGSQFISQYWDTICSRLGVRMAYSQAHRPQANGRAEVAGRVLTDLLRRLVVENGVNWAEALPRALRIHHDTIDPIINMTPYEAIFGRPRPIGGLPWEAEMECEEASDFFRKMEKLDQVIAEKMTEAHEKIARQVNARRHKRPPYMAGDWVWLARPKSVGGVKLQTYWRGPYKVESRVGQASYKIKIPQKGLLEVHADQLKPCIWELTGEITQVLVYPPLDNPKDGQTSEV